MIYDLIDLFLVFLAIIGIMWAIIGIVYHWPKGES